MTITGNFSDNAARFKTIRNIGIAIVVLILVECSIRSTPYRPAIAAW